MTEHAITFEVTETVDGVAQVTFTCGATEIVHTRSVNVHDCADEAALEQRFSEVANGVHNKICVGCITAQVEEEVEAPPTGPDDE
jgi:hypothetical protein